MGKEKPSVTPSLSETVFPAVTILPSQQPVLKGTQDTPNTNSSPKKKSLSPLDKAKEKNEKLQGLQVKLMRERNKWKAEKELFEKILAEMKHTESCLQKTCNHTMKSNDLSADLDNDIIPALPAGNIHGQIGNRLSETDYNTHLNNIKQETQLNLPNNNDIQDNSVHDVYFKTSFKYDADDACLNDGQLSRTSPDARGDQDFSDDYNKMALSESNENCFDSIFFSPYQVQQCGDLPFTENDTLNNILNEEKNYILTEDRLPSEVGFENLSENVLCNQHNFQSPQKANNGGSKQANKRTYSSFETLTQGYRTRCVKRKQAYIMKQKPEANTAGLESVAATGKDINGKSKNSTDVDPTGDKAIVCELVKESSLDDTETDKENLTKHGKGKETNNNAVKKAQTSVGILEHEGHSNDSNVETNSGMRRNIKERLDSAERTKEITTVDTCKVDSRKEATATAGIAQADSSKQEITTGVGKVDSVNDLKEYIATVCTVEVDGTKKNITTENTAAVDSSKQDITTAETAKVDSFNQEIIIAATAEVDRAKQEITTTETCNVDSFKQEITTDTGKVHSVNKEITTSGTAKVGGPKENITAANAAEVEDAKENITAANTAEVEDTKENITAANAAEVEDAKENITAADTAEVEDTKENITAADTAEVEDAKENITAADTAEVEDTKENITAANAAEVEDAKENITAADTAEVEDTKENITAADIAKVEDTKENITAANIADVEDAEENITAAGTAEVEDTKENITAANTAEVEDTKENITAANAAEVEDAKENTTAANAAEVEDAKANITAANTAKVEDAKENITAADTAKVEDTKENITAADITKVEDAKENITAADTAKVKDTKENITAASTVDVEDTKENITAAGAAEVDDTKENITIDNTDKTDRSKQEKTPADKAKVDSSKQEITAAETGKVDCSKQKITLAEDGNIDSFKHEIITADPAQVDVSSEGIHKTDTAQVDVSSEGIHKTDTAQVDVSSEGIHKTDTAKVDSLNNIALSATNMQQAGGQSSDKALSCDLFSMVLFGDCPKLENEAIAVNVNKTYQTMTKNNENGETSTDSVTNNAEE